MAEREYRPLARNLLRPFVSRYSAWLGRDHLLSVESKGFHERYRRFYFRDIQLVAIRGTSRRATLNWILAGSLLLFLLLTIASFRSGGRFLEVITLIADVFIATPLVINNILGPSCDVYVRTAVQEVRVPALGRLRSARKTLNLIRPLIETAQGAMTSIEMMGRLGALQSARTPGPQSPAKDTTEQQLDQIES